MQQLPDCWEFTYVSTSAHDVSRKKKKIGGITFRASLIMGILLYLWNIFQLLLFLKNLLQVLDKLVFNNKTP